jgi:hypothetical protein
MVELYAGHDVNHLMQVRNILAGFGSKTPSQRG